MANSRGEHGNAFVELALVLVPLMAILVAFFDFGTAIALKSIFQNAVREGVRYAVTYQTIAGHCQDDSIRLVVQQNAMGFLGDNVTPNSVISVKYYNPSVSLTTEVTGAAGNAPTNVVEVTVQGYQWNWLTNLSGDMNHPRAATPLSIIVYSSDRLGGSPTSGVPCR
jgi:Flp pilus assembly protein TadG